MNSTKPRNLGAILLMILILVSCKENSKPKLEITNKQENIKDETIHNLPPSEINTPDASIKDVGKIKNDTPSDLNEITEADGILLDIKYAGKDNFTKRKIYDCARCFLRPEATQALIAINNELLDKHGYSLKVFDCFRPKSYQQRLWDAVPDPDYVTPPAKGSMHSRGLAVDLTIVDKNGQDLDMGTEYDYFGEEAHQDYHGHSTEVVHNRLLLKSVMEKHGFKPIRTEWWHYSFRSKIYPIDSWAWSCD